MGNQIILLLVGSLISTLVASMATGLIYLARLKPSMDDHEKRLNVNDDLWRNQGTTNSANLVSLTSNKAAVEYLDRTLKQRADAIEITTEKRADALDRSGQERAKVLADSQTERSASIHNELERVRTRVDGLENQVGEIRGIAESAHATVQTILASKDK